LHPSLFRLFFMGVFATLYEDGLASPTGPGLGRPAPIHATQLVCTSIPNEPGSDEIGVCHLFSSQVKRPLLQLTSGPVCAACTAHAARRPAPRKRRPPAYPESQVWGSLLALGGQALTRARDANSASCNWGAQPGSAAGVANTPYIFPHWYLSLVTSILTWVEGMFGCPPEIATPQFGTQHKLKAAAWLVTKVRWWRLFRSRFWPLLLC
jgi:hypothetical protein